MVFSPTHISKWILLAVMSVLVCSCTGRNQSRPEIHIVRPEMGGNLNVVPIDVFVDGGMFGTLCTESTLIIPTDAGDHVVAVEYPNPFKDSERRRRAETHILVSRGIVTITVKPNSLNASAYSGEWDLIPGDNHTRPGPGIFH